MKGLVFTTFYDFLEKRYGADLLDDVIDAAGLPHSGAYTVVGTYPFDEMVALATAAAKLTGTSMPDLLGSFGEHCFSSWHHKMPAHFMGTDLFDILANVNDFHDSEVRRLYPDAELPHFETISRDKTRMVLDYRSCKPLADLAAGVIRGASNHVGTPVRISQCPMHQLEGKPVRIEVEKVR